MALKDALKTPSQKRTGYRSRIDEYREALDDEDRKALDAAVANPEWTTSGITNALNDDGLDISDSAVRDWRRRALKAIT